MKKSTLISTLAMVVIVALALTTATFAWYSANTTVTAQTTATAATASGSNLAIGTTNTASLTSLDLSAVSEMTPAAPIGNWSDEEFWAPTGEDATAPDVSSGTEIAKLLKTATINAEGVFTSDAGNATVLTTDFYVINKSTADGDAITPKVTLTTETVADADNDGTELLRVAVFKITATGWEYLGTLANTNNANVTFGSIVNGESSKYTTTDNPTQMDKYTATTDITLDSLAATADVHIGIIAWYDGSQLDNDVSGAACKFTLTFAKA